MITTLLEPFQLQFALERHFRSIERTQCKEAGCIGNVGRAAIEQRAYHFFARLKRLGSLALLGCQKQHLNGVFSLARCLHHVGAETRRPLDVAQHIKRLALLGRIERDLVARSLVLWQSISPPGIT